MNFKYRRFGMLSLVTLIVLGSCTKQEPIASFSVDQAQIAQGESVHFTDQSLNNPNSWQWTFQGGDPSSSGEQNPTVTYDLAGQYEVSLMVSNGDGSDGVQRKNCITVTLPAPEAAFTANKTSIFTGESITFTDQSTNEPTSWSWIFDGGTPVSSTDQNPVVQYQTEGVYAVGLLVSNAAGADYLQKDAYITVTKATTDLTFVNATYAEIDIEIGGVWKTAPVGGSVTYYDLSGSSVDFYAETSGETSDGTQIGVELVWDDAITLTSSQMSQRLIIGSDYFFLYFKNEGSHNINPLKVGVYRNTTPPAYFTDYEENILIPTDGVKYSIGYYEAPYNTGKEWTQIRAYYQDVPTDYTYWDYPNGFDLPDTINQSVTLTNPFKKSSITGSWKDSGDPATYLYPSYARKKD
jgi:PKD repeat protein